MTAVSTKQRPLFNILSFDCANKSLGVCAATIDANGKLEVVKLEVVDLIPGRKVKCTNCIERAIGLKNYLNKEWIKTCSWDLVLIEYQLISNDKSRIVSMQLCYHFADISKVKIVKPAAKNTIHFTNNLAYGNYAEKYSSNYVANKKHCAANLLHYVKTRNKMHLLKGIPKSRYADVGDAFMQMLAYLKINK